MVVEFGLDCSETSTLLKMKKLFKILFSILDSGFWQRKQINNWADHMISNISKPELWLIDLSLAKTSEKALDIIDNALREFSIQLPEETQELLIGFIILRYERGDITKENMKMDIFDVLDCYDSTYLDYPTFDKQFDEEDSKFNDYRSKALIAIEFLKQYAKRDTHIV